VQTANATDVDALAIEPGVGVRWVDHAAALGAPDLIVIPGSKATVADLDWLRATGIAGAIAESDAALLGICAGYQMLGRTIDDPCGIEARAGTRVDGLGLLDASTTFAPRKTLKQSGGEVWGLSTAGYEIHHGVTSGASADGRVAGTNLHGLFENDAFRRAFLVRLASLRGKTFTPATTSFEAARQRQLDALGDLIEAHVDLDAVGRLIEAGT
jgi:adenosylcobyric acid synthase